MDFITYHVFYESTWFTLGGGFLSQFISGPWQMLTSDSMVGGVKKGHKQ